MNKRPGCLATAEQELLLRAALLEGTAGLDACRQWLEHGQLDQLDEGSCRLLPLLYSNMVKNELRDPRMIKLKETYLRTFYKNQVLLFKSLVVVRKLQEAGIKVMLLKGGALLLHYKQVGVRPMHDLDVLVPTAKAQEATALLGELGWQPLFKAPHSQGFQSSDGGELDLHWHALLELSQKDSDDEFWNGAIQAEIQGLSLLVSNPTDLLFHVCIQWRKKWEPIPTFRWVADAAMILESGSEIDWNRLLHHGKKYGLTLPLKEALQYLKQLLNAPIPEAVLTLLEATSVTISERLDYKSRTSPHGDRGPFLTLWAYYREYRHWAIATASK